MSEPNEREILARLESSIDWSDQGVIEADGETLLSLDDTHAELIDAYESHVTAVGLSAAVDSEDFSRGFAQVAKLLNRDFEELTDIEPGYMLQTRGEGTCLVFDEADRMSETINLTDETRIRGTFVGIHIYPVLTYFAQITGQYNLPESYEPRPCLILEQSNVDSYDSFEFMTGVVAIPLWPEGLKVDLVV